MYKNICWMQFFSNFYYLLNSLKLVVLRYGLGLGVGVGGGGGTVVFSSEDNGSRRVH